MTEATADKAPETPALTPLADICKELGIKPVAARIKLRKKFSASKEKGFRWAFSAEQVEEVRTILLTKGKEKAAPEKDGEDEGGEDGDGEE